MKAALIVMTIMGCDDSATQCHYIETVDRSWQTVALCDAQAETWINKNQDKNYPVIVAVCETSDKQMAKAEAPIPSTNAELPVTTPQAQADAIPTPPVSEAQQPSLPRRTLALVTGAMPDTAKLREAITRPVHTIEGGYSWVARKFTR